MFKRFMLLAVTATMMCFAAQAQKFGYVNTSEIFNVMPEKATAENTLKSVSDKYETEFKNLQDAFQKKMADYETADKEGVPQVPTGSRADKRTTGRWLRFRRNCGTSTA